MCGDPVYALYMTTAHVMVRDGRQPNPRSELKHAAYRRQSDVTKRVCQGRQTVCVSSWSGQKIEAIALKGLSKDGLLIAG